MLRKLHYEKNFVLRRKKKVHLLVRGQKKTHYLDYAPVSGRVPGLNDCVTLCICSSGWMNNETMKFECH